MCARVHVCLLIPNKLREGVGGGMCVCECVGGCSFHHFPQRVCAKEDIHSLKVPLALISCGHGGGTPGHLGSDAGQKEIG